MAKLLILKGWENQNEQPQNAADLDIRRAYERQYGRQDRARAAGIKTRRPTRYYTPHEVADLLGVSTWLVYQLMRRKVLGHQPIGRLKRISDLDIENYLADQRMGRGL